MNLRTFLEDIDYDSFSMNYSVELNNIVPLFFYDENLIFTGKCDGDDMIFYRLLDSDSNLDYEYYLASHITKENIQKIMDNELTIYDAINMNVESEVFRFVKGTHIVKDSLVVSTYRFPETLLPEKDAYLNPIKENKSVEFFTLKNMPTAEYHSNYITNINSDVYPLDINSNKVVFYGKFLSYGYIFYKLSSNFLLAMDCGRFIDFQYFINNKKDITKLVGGETIRIYSYINEGNSKIKLEKEWVIFNENVIYDELIQEVQDYIKSIKSPEVNKNDAELKKNEVDPKLGVGSKKPSTAAIPPISILLLGLAMKDGEKKYGRFNWRKTKVDNSVYYDAAMRHLLSYWDGEEKAKDSNIEHLAHVMACCAILIDAHYTNSCLDTRDPTLNVTSFIDEYYKRNKENG